MEVQIKVVKDRLIQLLDTVTADGAEYIFHSINQDSGYNVLVKTPLGHTKIFVPHQLIEQDTLSRQDREFVFYQIFPEEVLWRIRNSNPDEIYIPEIRPAPRMSWRQMVDRLSAGAGMLIEFLNNASNQVGRNKAAPSEMTGL